MDLLEMAKDYMKRAETRLKSASLALSEASYPDVVRFSQECVELSLKAALRSRNVEYPKEHDIGKILKQVIDRFPDWLRSEVDRISEISSDLASKRAASMYGLEVANKPPGSLFSKNDALISLKDAEYVFKTIKKVIEQT
ncbi:MAG: HEPN domain-containing protein [Conexivisphaerales archaeon]